MPGRASSEALTEAATIALCGPCRHFLMAFSPPHGCALGLPLQDGAQRTECASFSPFTKGEGSMFEQSDCCAGDGSHTHEGEGSHSHAADPTGSTPGASP